MLDRLMKILVVAASLAVLIFVVLWMQRAPEKKGAEAPLSAPPSTRTFQERAPVRLPPPAPAPVFQGKPPVAHAGLSPYAQKPKDLTVEFDLINGVAIAYGDTILGRPAEGQTIIPTHGSTEAPLPQYWKNGIVPYGIQPNVPNPKRIEDAIEFFNQHTSVKFVPYQGQADALIFEKGPEHCYSYLGRVGGLQPVSLADNCGPPEIMHELMHALGFVHEQSRTDRDQFVEVLWDNIEEKFKSQFAMVPEVMMEAYHGATFDEHSIMLYDPRIFTVKPGLPNMRSLSAVPLEPHQSLSDQDIHRVNRLYGFE